MLLCNKQDGKYEQTAKQTTGRQGALEMALMLPWYLFFFVGTYDWGYYAHP